MNTSIFCQTIYIKCKVNIYVVNMLFLYNRYSSMSHNKLYNQYKVQSCNRQFINLIRSKVCILSLDQYLCWQTISSGVYHPLNFLSVVGKKFFNDYLRIDTKRFPISVKWNSYMYILQQIEWINFWSKIPDRKHYKLTEFSLLFTTFHFFRES
jgi:hypothetical protein